MMSVVALSLNAQVYTEYFTYSDPEVAGGTRTQLSIGDDIETGDAQDDFYYGWYLNAKSSNREVGPNNEASPKVSAEGALGYNGYIASAEGNSVKIDSAVAYSSDQRSSNWAVNDRNGDTLRMPSSGAVYAAILYKPLLNSYSSIRDFFGFEFSSTSNSSRGRVFVNPDGNDVQFGVSKNKSKESDGLELSEVFTGGMESTYLLVLKYEVIGDKASDDIVKLWVNPDVTLGEEEDGQVTALSSINETSTSDISAGTIVRLNIRQRGNNGLIGNIVVASDWESVLHGPTLAESISIDQADFTLGVRSTQQLDVTFDPEDASDKRLIWSSSDEDIVSVDDDGVVTALGLGGENATITAKSVEGDFESTVVVTTEWIPVTGVSLDESTLTVGMNYSKTLTETIAPEDASDISVTWSSSNEDVATVEDGVVTSVSVGTANITAKTADGDFEATCAVTVEEIAVTGVVLDSVSFNLGVGATAQVTATVSPADAFNQTVTWSSSNEDIATVVDGLVTSIGVGTATITATADGDFKATCEVTATVVAVTGVTLDQSQLELVVGNTGTLVETVTPADAFEQTVTWSSSNEDIATVVDGLVTAVGSGSATIRVTTIDGSFFAECTVLTRLSGVNETSISALSIYPNPSNGAITIANVAGADVMIYDVTGKVVYQASDINGAQSINGLSQGFYFVSVKTADAQEVTKIIVE
jgi:uncharacterized protein YjdB